MNTVKIVWTAPARPLFRGVRRQAGGMYPACGADENKESPIYAGIRQRYTYPVAKSNRVVLAEVYSAPRLIASLAGESFTGAFFLPLKRGRAVAVLKNRYFSDKKQLIIKE